MESIENCQLNRIARTALAVGLLLSAAEACTHSAGQNPVMSHSASQNPSPVPEVSTSPTDLPSIKPVTENPLISLQKTLNSELPGMPKLDLDGKLGPQTMRAVCAVRFLTGKQASKNKPTSTELLDLEQRKQLHAQLSGLIVSRTCQIMAVNIDEHLNMVLPVSTGRPGYETPAIDGHIFYGHFGWHNSSLFPAEHGNGNIYKPMYFSGSTAAHGSREMYPSVTTPHSHGCVRVIDSDADKLWKLAGGPDRGNQDHYVGNLKPIPVHVL